MYKHEIGIHLEADFPESENIGIALYKDFDRYFANRRLSTVFVITKITKDLVYIKSNDALTQSSSGYPLDWFKEHFMYFFHDNVANLLYL